MRTSPNPIRVTIDFAHMTHDEDVRDVCAAIIDGLFAVDPGADMSCVEVIMADGRAATVRMSDAKDQPSEPPRH